MRRLLLSMLLVVFGALSAGAAMARDDVVRIGLTAVVVRENLRVFDRFSAYLGAQIGRQVEFVHARSYRDVMSKLRTGQVDFAWICGYPYVAKREPEYLDLLAVPVYAGAPLYQSYIIVHKDNPATSFDDLQGSVFGYSDPDSNSGYLYPRYSLIKRGQSPETFFRATFFTYSHAETIQAVAQSVADAGAVDSYVWESLRRSQPELTAQTRIIERSGLFGFPPLVTRRGVVPDLAAKMRRALYGMNKDATGQKILADLDLDAFDDAPDTLFNSIREMVSQMNGKISNRSASAVFN